MAAHACLKNEFTEDEKYHNLMTLLIFAIKHIAFSHLGMDTLQNNCKYAAEHMGQLFEWI